DKRKILLAEANNKKYKMSSDLKKRKKCSVARCISLIIFTNSFSFDITSILLILLIKYWLLNYFNNIVIIKKD
ncbi:hypothetical protein, partial [Borreliella burgdorferi]|uniref:hypothetical protein n=1 Tax=Borreliella burgdorferi TaxID=139 RepID=UPI001E3F4A12